MTTAFNLVSAIILGENSTGAPASCSLLAALACALILTCVEAGATGGAPIPLKP